MSKMKEKCRILSLLMYQKLLIRKCHWKTAIFIQILLPISLFCMILGLQAIKSFAPPPVPVDSDTVYDTDEMDLLLSGSNYLRIYYVPNNVYTKDIMLSVSKCLDYSDTSEFFGFETESDALGNYTVEQSIEHKDVVMVIFKSNSTSKKFEYVLRTQNSIPEEMYVSPGLSDMYTSTFLMPFLPLQHCLNMKFIESKVRDKPDIQKKTKITMQQMPLPPYIKIDSTYNTIKMVICLIATFAFLIPLCSETNFLANEKLIGVNVLMLMNGVETSTNLLSWWLNGLLFSILYISPVVILLKTSFSSEIYPLLYYSNGVIFWLILFVHIGHLIAFGMHITSYFAKPLFITLGLWIVYILSTLIIKFTVSSSFRKHTPYLGIIFPNILLFRAIDEMNDYEEKLSGIHWRNLFLSSDQTYNVTGSMGMILIFSIIGTVLHFYFTIYLYAIKPGKYGVKKHPLYFLEYFRRNKVNTSTNIVNIDYQNNRQEPFEPILDKCTPGIQIRNLKKSYCTNIFNKSATVDALKGISIDFYKSQITALLGHNSAGKTTMMAILNGMISPTGGTVLINGKNVSTDLDRIMNDIGMCPQDNMLFPDLSVMEHLLFFGMLKQKQKTRKEVERDVDQLLRKLNLSEKRNNLPAQLSGGQKRRVCLGMALIGDANILILDEPTSGMDPESRRDVWNTILSMRENRTILISTHNMEEADILGDRIAIIHSGSLKCYGTSIFLKKLYGQGNIEITLSTDATREMEKICNTLSSRAEIINVDNGRIILSVPYTDELPDALDRLESSKKSLGVTGISVSLITLEQVFLKVTKETENTIDSNIISAENVPKVTGSKLFVQRIYAIFSKKLLYAQKNIGIILLMMLIPIVGVVSMMNFSVSSLKSKYMTEDVIPFHLSLYQNPQAYYLSNKPRYAQEYANVIVSQGGVSYNVAEKSNLNEVLLNIAKKDNTIYYNNVIIAAEFNTTDEDLSAIALYSSTATYSLPISMHILYNAILKSFTGDDYEIITSTQTLPLYYFQSQKDEEYFYAYGRAFLFTIFVFPMVALFIIQPLKENLSGIKHLQRMTGTSCSIYWLTTFFFDFLVYFLSSILIISLIAIMDSVYDLRLFQSHEISIMLMLLILFALNMLPLMYILSFWKRQVNTIINIMISVPICLIILDLILEQLMVMILNDKIRKGLLHFQKVIFHFVPHLNFFKGNIAFGLTAVRNARCRHLPNYLVNISCISHDKCCELECLNGTCNKNFPYFRNFSENPSLEGCILSLACLSIFYFALLFIIEMNLIPKLFNKMKKFKIKSIIENSDEQVKLEKAEVAVEINKIKSKNRAHSTKEGRKDTVNHNFSSTKGNDINSLFLVYELSKKYRKLFAVKEVSFKIKPRECFGLLGINGAGKSTTFRMLTGEELPDNGSLYLKEKDINSQKAEYLSQMGYCPQNHALIETLNTKDHLRLFALLRGIPKANVETEVKTWIEKLNLHVCATKPSVTYSGGNKRRLSIAISMIANPSLVLLDEPTTGVDPAARRSLWKVIASSQLGGQSIILTSHSMEECEALCNRLVIMVKGELVCIGPSQQLKQKFGVGFDIQIKLKSNVTAQAIIDLKNEMKTRLPCKIADENAGLIAYHVTNDKLTWRAMHNAMNILKENHYCIDDYTIISATLEQLFLQFARAAKVSSIRSDNHPSVV